MTVDLAEFSDDDFFSSKFIDMLNSTRTKSLSGDRILELLDSANRPINSLY